MRPLDPLLPGRLPDEPPAALARGGLVLALAPGDPERALFDAIAASLAAPPLSLACSVLEVAPGGPRPGSGVVFDLARVADRGRRLAWLASSVERFVLDGGR